MLYGNDEDIVGHQMIMMVALHLQRDGKLNILQDMERILHRVFFFIFHTDIKCVCAAQFFTSVKVLPVPGVSECYIIGNQTCFSFLKMVIQPVIQESSSVLN